MVRGYSIGEVLRVQNGTLAAGPSSAEWPLAVRNQGDNCVWDANDGGPDQCTPQVKGRFKRRANDSCAWDANDAGPDQCRPPKGRWKKVATTPARGTRTTTVRISATHGRRSKPRGPSNQTQSRTLLDPNKRNSGDDTEHQADQELVNAMACERQTRPEDRGDHRDDCVADRGTE